MALLTIRYYPDPILKKVSDPLTDFGAQEQAFFDDLIQTMLARDGVGLAASQVGVSKRVIVASPTRKRETVEVFVNPVIVSREGAEAGEKGCLSFPGLYASIIRAKKLCFQYQDRNGMARQTEDKDFFARVIQHEMDHLDGILMIDRVDFNKRHELLALYNGVR